jgi:hypothetical protein
MISLFYLCLLKLYYRIYYQIQKLSIPIYHFSFQRSFLKKGFESYFFRIEYSRWLRAIKITCKIKFNVGYSRGKNFLVSFRFQVIFLLSSTQTASCCVQMCKSIVLDQFLSYTFAPANDLFSWFCFFPNESITFCFVSWTKSRTDHIIPILPFYLAH